MSRRAAILSLSTWALAATPLYAAEATLTRPDPPGTPTPVTLGVFVADVAWIDDAAQTFEVDLFVTLGWHDHRLAWTPTEGEGDARLLPLSAVWNPELLLLNRRQVSRFFPDQVRISPDGSVRSRQRLQATLTAHFDLREFPLDRQTLEIQAVSTRGPDEVALSTDPATSGHLERFSITGWSVEPGTPRIDSFEILPGSRRVVRFVLPIDAVRDRAYYLWKAMLPTALIVFMAWTVFSLDHSTSVLGSASRRPRSSPWSHSSSASGACSRRFPTSPVPTTTARGLAAHFRDVGRNGPRQPDAGERAQGAGRAVGSMG